MVVVTLNSWRLIQRSVSCQGAIKGHKILYFWVHSVGLQLQSQQQRVNITQPCISHKLILNADDTYMYVCV